MNSNLQTITAQFQLKRSHIVIIILCVICNFPALCQESNYNKIQRIINNADSISNSDKIKSVRKNIYWLNGGIWFSTKTLEGIVDFNINYAVKRNLISAQYLVVNDLLYDDIFKPMKDTYSYGLLYGRYFTNDLIIASLYTGFSIINIVQSVETGDSTGDSFIRLPVITKKSYYKFGIPIKAQLMIRGKYVGVSLSSHININSDMPYQKLCIGISLGKFK